MVFLERDRSAPELAKVEACPPREREAERSERDSHPGDPRLRRKERQRQRRYWRTKQQERPIQIGRLCVMREPEDCRVTALDAQPDDTSQLRSQATQRTERTVNGESMASSRPGARCWCAALYLQFRGLDLLGIDEEGVPGRPCCLEAMSLRVRSAPRPLRLCRGVSEAASLHPQGW